MKTTPHVVGAFTDRPFAGNPAAVCLLDAIGRELRACGLNGMDCLIEVADENTLRALRPNFSALATLPVRGVIATCRSESPAFDFVSRLLAPSAGVNEDPVTGSAHCALGPYWQAKRGDRELLRGQAVMMSRVEMMR